MRTVTTNVRNLKDGRFIPQGLTVEITFDGDVSASMTGEGEVFYVDGVKKPVRISLIHAYKWLKGFRSPPSDKTIEKWMDEGIAMTVTGKRVEPDGVGPDGSPSWLIVLGMI